MVPMRGCKTVEAFHAPRRRRAAILAAGFAGILPAEHLGGRDAARTGRLEACPTCPPRFMAPLRVENWRSRLSTNAPGAAPMTSIGGVAGSHLFRRSSEEAAEHRRYLPRHASQAR